MVLEFADNLRRKCQMQFVHCDKEHTISQYYSKFLLVFSWELRVSREVYRNLKQKFLFTNYFQCFMSSLEVIYVNGQENTTYIGVRKVNKHF